MFLTKLTASDLKYIEKEATGIDNQYYDLIYSALLSQHYEICCRYVKDREQLHYAAYLKDEENGLPSVIEYASSPFFSSTDFYDKYLVKRNKAAVAVSALTVYLSEQEKARYMKDSRGVKELYNSIDPMIVSLSLMNKKDYQKRQELRSDFLRFTAEFKRTWSGRNSLNTLVNGNVRVQFSFTDFRSSYNKEKFLKINLKAGTSFLYAIRDIPSFLHDYEYGINQSLGKKFNGVISKYTVLPEIKEAMDFLLEAYHSGTLRMASPYEVLIKEESAAYLLLRLKGQKIYMDNMLYLCSSEEEKGALNLDEKGNLNLNPAVLSSSAALRAGDKLIVFDKSDDRSLYYKVRYLAFNDLSLLELYKFFTDHSEADFKEVSDLLYAKLPGVVPSLLSSRKKDPSFPFKINYYVDEEEDGSLVFKTGYKENDKDLTLKEVKENGLYYSLYNDFHRVLNLFNLKDNGEIKDEDIILNFLNMDLSALQDVANIYLSEKFKNAKRNGTGDLRLKVRKNGSMLDISVISSLYSAKEVQEILSAYHQKKKFFVLNGNYILLDEEHSSSLKEVSDALKNMNAEEESEVEVPLYNILPVMALEQDGLSVDKDEEVSEIIQKVQDYHHFALPFTPEEEKNLRPYQKDGVRWLLTLAQYGFSGILADDMGLGKTYETIVFMEKLNDERPLLVICPKGLIYNWANEIRKWSSLTPFVIDGNKSERTKTEKNIVPDKKNVYIISYDSMRLDEDLLTESDYALTVIDEAQFIKNATTKKAKAVKKIRSSLRLALTGTPIENSLTDLWSIFDFLMPSYLGNLTFFNDEYEEAFSEEEDKDDNYNKRKREKLLARVQPFILRRTKEEVIKELPGKSEMVMTLNFEESQRQLYDSYLQEALNIYEDEQKEKKGKIKILSALMRLRQICVDPSSFLTDFKDLPSKFEWVLNATDEIIASGHKIVFFSQFTTVLSHLKKLLEEKGYASFSITGKTLSEDRVKIAEHFNTKNDVKLLFVSLKAGGVGLNLIGADIVIHLDPWWNYAAEEQATDRTYRLGQTRPVTVYKLIIHNSIEEKVMELQNRKKKLYEAVIKSEDKKEALSDDDIRFLLS